MTIPILAWLHLWTYIERRGRQRCYCWNLPSWKHGRSKDLGSRNDDTIRLSKRRYLLYIESFGVSGRASFHFHQTSFIASFYFHFNHHPKHSVLLYIVEYDVNRLRKESKSCSESWSWSTAQIRTEGERKVLHFQFQFNLSYLGFLGFLSLLFMILKKRKEKLQWELKLKHR